jgi:hypothetical protein
MSVVSRVSRWVVPALAGAAVAIAATTPAVASHLIHSGDIANNAVTSSKIKTNAVTGAKINANAVTSAKIKNHTVSAADLSTAVTSQLPTSAAQTLVPTALATPQKLMALSGLGTFDWSCSSTSKDALLQFTEAPGLKGSVEVAYQEVTDPGTGTGVADMAVEFLDPASPLIGFLPAVGVDSRAQFSIQLAAQSSGRVATVTLSLNYPGNLRTNCGAIGQAVTGTAT